MNSSYVPDITRHLSASQEAVGDALRDSGFIEATARATEAVTQALRAGKKVLIAGNGGSAADAQHLATELMVRFHLDRAPLPAIALGTDAPSTTAIGNDLGFERLFSRQVLALGHEGDVFIALSTSGQSPNILAACEAARSRQMRVIGFTGSRRGPMDELCEILARVPSDKTPLIQQVYMAAGHALCEIVERELAKTAD
jgi:D-sedoheptulose 7-phosphate isomerase